MDVDGVEALVSAEELLPERRERDGAAGHEEEGDLGDPLEGEFLGGGDERGAPEELVVGHGVGEVGRVHEGLEPGPAVAGGAPAVAVGGAVGVGGEEELRVGVVVVAGDVGADGEPDDDARHEDDHGRDELEQPRRPVLARRRREVVPAVAASPAADPAAGLEHRLRIPPHLRRRRRLRERPNRTESDQDRRRRGGIGRRSRGRGPI